MFVGIIVHVNFSLYFSSALRVFGSIYRINNHYLNRGKLMSNNVDLHKSITTAAKLAVYPSSDGQATDKLYSVAVAHNISPNEVHKI